MKDALNLDPDHHEAKSIMSEVTKRANTNKIQAMQLNIAGKHREALQKISIAIETDPSVADFHVLRYIVKGIRVGRVRGGRGGRRWFLKFYFKF